MGRGTDATRPSFGGRGAKAGYSRRQSERAALAERSTSFLPYSICASKIGASGVSLAHLVAEAWKSIAWLATFSLVSMYHAANFFAPLTLRLLRRLLIPSANPESCCLCAVCFSLCSDISLPPDFFRRDASPPVDLLRLTIESDFARFFFRLRDDTGGFTLVGFFSLIAPFAVLSAQPMGSDNYASSVRIVASIQSEANSLMADISTDLRRVLPRPFRPRRELISAGFPRRRPHQQFLRVTLGDRVAKFLAYRSNVDPNPFDIVRRRQADCGPQGGEEGARDGRVQALPSEHDVDCVAEQTADGGTAKEPIGYAVGSADDGVVRLPGSFMKLAIDSGFRDGAPDLGGWRLGHQALGELEHLIGKRSVVGIQIYPGVAVVVSHRRYPSFVDRCVVPSSVSYANIAVTSRIRCS